MNILTNKKYEIFIVYSLKMSQLKSKIYEVIQSENIFWILKNSLRGIMLRHLLKQIEGNLPLQNIRLIQLLAEFDFMDNSLII